jgi:hypothetical protein
MEIQWTFLCLVTLLWHGKPNGPKVVWLQFYGMENTMDLSLSGYSFMLFILRTTKG